MDTEGSLMFMSWEFNKECHAIFQAFEKERISLENSLEIVGVSRVRRFNNQMLLHSVVAWEASLHEYMNLGFGKKIYNQEQLSEFIGKERLIKKYNYIAGLLNLRLWHTKQPTNYLYDQYLLKELRNAIVHYDGTIIHDGQVPERISNVVTG